MIEISISRELAAAHSGFMAHCADRGHAVSVFDSDEARSPISRDRRGRDAPGRVTTPWGPEGRSNAGQPGPNGLRTRRPGRVPSDLRRPATAGANPTERRPPMA